MMNFFKHDAATWLRHRRKVDKKLRRLARQYDRQNIYELRGDNPWWGETDKPLKTYIRHVDMGQTDLASIVTHPNESD